jgi:hypothetical protein
MLLIKQDVSKVKYVQSRNKSAKCSENVFINEKLLESTSKCAKNEESMKIEKVCQEHTKYYEVLQNLRKYGQTQFGFLTTFFIHF